jgi:hypothetical protein
VVSYIEPAAAAGSAPGSMPQVSLLTLLERSRLLVADEGAATKGGRQLTLVHGRPTVNASALGLPVEL